MGNVSRNFGRFKYIEPNDVLETNLYNKSSKEKSYNITQPYEDYSISVELEVEVPNRGVWVADLTNTTNIGVHTNKNDTISFFAGKDGHLTDTPGSLIYTDILKNTQDTESLGITNIHISYNSYFYPEVVVKFTDIRGMGLMMPHEECYRQEYLYRENKQHLSRVDKFFAALFTFPYPTFTLKVKGFYGKKVEYSLVVSEFKSNFNNQTGNFEATVKFIGKMYGVYTDIPMTYLLVAPYCKYGNVDGRTIWQQHNFKFPGTNTPIPTFVELKDNIVKALKDVENQLSREFSEELETTRVKENLLHNVDLAYKNFIATISSNWPYTREMARTVISSSNIFLFQHEQNNDGTGYKYLYGNGTNKQLVNAVNNLYTKITLFNQNITDNSLPYPTAITSTNIRIGNDEKYLVTVKKDAADNLTFDWADKSLEINLTEYGNIVNKLKESINRESSKQFFVINALNFAEKLKEVDEVIKDSIKAQDEEMREAANAMNEQILKFNPSIKNVFTVLMAHLQTFMELFNTCITNINGNRNRTISKKGLSKDRLPDIPSGISDSAHLPPFPAFQRIDNQEFCYPTDSGIIGTLEETDFIDSLLIGTSDFNKAVNEGNRYGEASNISNKFFIPTCITDFNCYKNNTDSENLNPYHYVFDCKEDNLGLDWVWTYFAMRCIQKYIMEQNEDLTPEEFGKYEAYNFWLANPRLDEDPIKHNQCVDALTNGDYSKKNDFIQFLLKNKNNDAPKRCYQTSAGFTNLLQDTGSDLRLQSYNDLNVNFPARIGHGDNFKKQFVQDTKRENIGYSYIEGEKKQGKKEYTCKGDKLPLDYVFTYASIPYKLMSEINSKKLQEWNTGIKGYKNMPEDVTKHEDIISKHYTSKKSFYYNNKTNVGSFKGYDTNPAWNVVYNTESTTGNFFQFIKKPLVETFNSALCTLNDHVSGEVENSKLLDIHTLNQEPLFITNNLTPIDFLFAIPHDFERIAKDLRDGKKLINIPYPTKLFLGYIIQTVQDCETLNSMKSFFVNLVKKCGAAYKGLGRTNPPNYLLEGNNDNFINSRFASLISHLLDYLTTTKDGLMTLPSRWNSLLINNEPELVARYVWANKANGAYQNDIFNFSTAYVNWVEDTNVGGFAWFKNKMCLKINPKLRINEKNININIENDKYSQIDLLKDLLSRESIYKTLQDLSDKHKDVLANAIMDNDNILKYIFSYQNEEIEYKEGENTPMSNAFSDIYTSVYCQGTPKKIENIYLKFNETYEGVVELNNFLTNVCYIIVPYELHTENSLSTPKTNLESAFSSFIKTIKDLYAVSVNENEKTITESDVTYVGTDSKLSMYRTLKNLYDKHLSNITEEVDNYSIDPNKADTELKRFHFIDTYYENIGDKFMVNASTLLNLLNIIDNGYESGKGEGTLSAEMSVYSFMSLICQKHNMMLMAMPVFNGAINDSDNFEKMFVPLPYAETQTKNSLHGPSYICFYPHQPSQYLDIPVSQYSNDGFLITDINDTQHFEGASTISEMQNEGYVIPAFGVEYGTQKQSIFQNINVNMDNPQVTEASVAVQFGIASNNNTDPQRLVFEGQDLYKIYSNYSYTCQVDMMGCAQIQPLMYFQLNNVPMFRGAYQIIQVEHDITPGNMVTSFKGVRINKNIMPMANNYFIVNIDNFLKHDGVTGGDNDNVINGNEFTFMPLESSKVNINAMNNHNKSTVSAQSLLNDEKLKKYIKFAPGKETRFNWLNPSLRQLVYCILQDMEALSKKVGYDIGIYITSATRDEGSEKSDHRRRTPEYNLTFEKRIGLTGQRLANDGQPTDENASYELMGAAIDFIGTKDGVISREDASIHLFHHIAMNYNKYIKQIIWEIKNGKPSVNNNISNCIHLSSIGEATTTNVSSIHMAVVTHDNGICKTNTVEPTNKKILAPAFTAICDKLISQSLPHLPRSRFLSYKNLKS